MEGGAPSVASSSQSEHSWALISLVLSQQHNHGEPTGSSSALVYPAWPLVSTPHSLKLSPEALIGEVYVEKIMEKLHATLTETKGLWDAGDLEPLISFICDVASTFFSSVNDCLLLPSAEELLLAVFQLTAASQTHRQLSGRFSLVKYSVELVPL